MLRKFLPVTAGAVGATAALGTVATQDTRSLWYASLDKPAYQPPGPLFGIVWTVLYADIAVTAAMALDALHDRDENGKQTRAYPWALATNLALNAGWCWVFFKAHRLGPAVLVAAALAGSSADLVRRTAAADRRAGIALSPYALWCGFATVLSTSLWRRNRR